MNQETELGLTVSYGYRMPDRAPLVIFGTQHVMDPFVLMRQLKAEFPEQFKAVYMEVGSPLPTNGKGRLFTG